MKLLTRIVLPPLALVTVFLAVANRHRVLFSFDPFDTEQPALALEVPLFAIVLAAVFIGMMIGGAAVWARQSRRRKVARIEKAPTPPDRVLAALTARPPAAD